MYHVCLRWKQKKKDIFSYKQGRYCGVGGTELDKGPPELVHGNNNIKTPKFCHDNVQDTCGTTSKKVSPRLLLLQSYFSDFLNVQNKTLMSVIQGHSCSGAVSQAPKRLHFNTGKMSFQLLKVSYFCRLIHLFRISFRYFRRGRLKAQWVTFLLA